MDFEALRADLSAAVQAVEQLAHASASKAFASALQLAAGHAVDLGGRPGALTLSSDHVPVLSGSSLSGRASWIAPADPGAVAIVAGRSGDALVACAVALDQPGVVLEMIETAGLRGVAFANAVFSDALCQPLGPTMAIMARVRVLLAAAGLGMGRRALDEALAAVKRLEGRPQGAAGEQTVQGLLADAATEIEAASLLTWKAASAGTLSLGDASMAKLAATEATQRAVARATQVMGADSFTGGHIVERLAQDVRALELFAGRTEALREAIAVEVLPPA
jgi:acyl-CoA dehydrogenase